MGFKLHHGLRNTPWGEKCYLGEAGGKGRGVCVILYYSADTTRDALKAMAAQASLPPLCGSSTPNAHAVVREGEGEGTLLLVPSCASLFSTEQGSGSGPPCGLGLHRLLFGENLHP